MAAIDVLNKVTKWRLLFVGRLLGTRTNVDPVAIGFRDLFNTLICLRAENNALARLLIEKKVFSDVEWDATLAAEANHLDKMYEKTFPGWRSTPEGLQTIDIARAAKTMEGWPA